MATVDDLPVIDMADPGFWSDVHTPLRAALDVAPLARTPSGDVIVLGHAEVEQFLRDPRMRTTDLLATNGLTSGPLHEWWSRVMFSTDPPDHTRLRRLVSRAFTPQRVEAMGPTITAIADAVLAPHLERGEIDLLHDYAHQLPIRVMGHMLAIPDDDFERFADWTADLGLVFSAIVDIDLRARLERSYLALDAYVRELVERRRAAPADDLLSALVAAEEAGDRLSNDELVAMVANLLFAGHDTTRSYLSIALPLLVAHPEQMAALRADPALMSSAAEECLRFEPPVMGSSRTPTVDVEIAGVTLPAGVAVSVSLPAANRDRRAFDGPDRFDVTRFAAADHRPAAIASFGHGVHFCLGAALARAEGRIGIERALTLLDGLEITEPLRWVPWAHIRRYERVPARFRS